MSHRLVIPMPDGWLNSNHRLHWRAKADRTRVWRNAACWLAKSAGLPPMDRAHIEATIHFTDRRRRDIGNLAPTLKAIVDGLVDAGVLPDDSDEYLTGPDLRKGSLTAGPVPVVELTITDLTPPEETR